MENPPFYTFVVDCGGAQISKSENLAWGIDDIVARFPTPKA